MYALLAHFGNYVLCTKNTLCLRGSGPVYLQLKSIIGLIIENRNIPCSAMIPLHRQKWASDFSASSGWILFQLAIDKCWPTSAAKMTTLLLVSLSWKAEERLKNEKEVKGYERHLPWTYSDIFLLANRDGGGGSRGLWKTQSSMAFFSQVFFFCSSLKALKTHFSISFLLWARGPMNTKYSAKDWTILVISVERLFLRLLLCVLFLLV